MAPCWRSSFHSSSNWRSCETEPGVRGDTAQGATKPATLGPGAVVQVPLFVKKVT